jgi:hypothetical protein
MALALLTNIKCFHPNLTDRYFFIDIIIACIWIISIIVNTILLIIIKRKIKILLFDIFLIHIIMYWIAFIIFAIRYEIYSFRVFLLPLILLVIYFIFSLKIKTNKNNKKKQNGI